jgi:hypothetical protein
MARARLGDAQKHKHHAPEEVAAHDWPDFLPVKNERGQINRFNQE